jgi:hypothetical protein
MEVNAIDCFRGTLEKEQVILYPWAPTTGVLIPTSEYEFCFDLLTSTVCPAGTPGCFVYANTDGKVEFGCGIKSKCDSKGNCCSIANHDNCNCYEAYIPKQLFWES